MSITYEDIEPWMPGYAKDFSPSQTQCLDKIIKEISSGKSGTHVLAAPCGIGKTTLIQGVIAHNITADPVVPMIIATDRKDRLAEYVQSKELAKKVVDSKYCQVHGHKPRDLKQMVMNLSDEESENMMAVRKTPVVLLSLQKYNLMDKRSREELLKYEGEDGEVEYRAMMLIDERTISHEIITIKNEDLHAIRGLLQDQIKDEKERRYATSIFSEFLIWIEEEEQKLECMKSTVALPFICERKTIAVHGSSDERKFLDILRKNGDALAAADPGFRKKMKAIYNLITPGNCSLFIRTGKAGFRYFLTKISYQSHYQISIPLYVLDGSADIDIEYGAPFFDRIDFSEYARSFPGTAFHFLRAKSNSTMLVDRKYRKLFVEHIVKASRVEGNAKEEVLVTTYKMMRGEMAEAFGIERIGTYGAITGKNDWRDCRYLVKTGVLRKPRILEYLDACEYYPELWDKVVSGGTDTAEGLQKACETLNRISCDAEEDFKLRIDEVAVNIWMCDFIQEFYRLRIRNYNDDAAVLVKVFCDVRQKGSNIYTLFYDCIKAYFTKRGASVEFMGSIKELYQYEKANRESPKNSERRTACYKIWRTLTAMPDGSEFTQQGLAEQADITITQLRTEIARNEDLRTLMTEMESRREERKKIYRMDEARLKQADILL